MIIQTQKTNNKNSAAKTKDRTNLPRVGIPLELWKISIDDILDTEENEKNYSEDEV